MLATLFTLFGLILFEVTCSVDNAVINAGVLQTMSKRSRRWFLTWGILIAVFLLRGILPWLLVWAVNPGMTAWESLKGVFTSSAAIGESLERSAPLLLAGAGSFMVALFLHWLFMEEKKIGFPYEKILLRNSAFFWVAIVSLVSGLWMFATYSGNVGIAYAGMTGLGLFGLTSWVKQGMEQREQALLGKHGPVSDWRKILYLELIDAVFSIDAILGALAFTFSVPLILIGNGIGAIAMRQLTVRNIHMVKRYRYLKNGAMYSMGLLGFIMLLHMAGIHVPDWVSPAGTLAIIGVAFLRP